METRTLKGWIARSQGIHWTENENGQLEFIENNYNGSLDFFTTMPKRQKWFWHAHTGEYIQISKPGQPDCFKDLSWLDEPKEVELTIKTL